MTYSIEQYKKAISDLQLGLQQHEEGTHQMGCSICEDSHGVDECPRNPLKAMTICEHIAKTSDELHDILHYLSGYYTYMGEQVGPASVFVPEAVGNGNPASTGE